MHQLSFDPSAIARWCEDVAYEGDIYAGIIALASDKMGHRLAERIPGFAVPDSLLKRLPSDPSAGVEAAVETMMELKSLDVVHGVHLVPARRYREVAATLEQIDV